MPRPDVSLERKAQIIEAAKKVFLKKGFDAARMEEIAETAGLSIGGVYWYYKSKEEIILDLMDGVTHPDLKDLHTLLEAPGTVLERLADYIRSSIPPAVTLAPLFYEIYSLGGREQETRERLRDYFRSYRDLVAALLIQGVKSGEFRPLDIPQTATMFAALYEGMIELAMLDPENVDGVHGLLSGLDTLFQGLKPDRI